MDLKQFAGMLNNSTEISHEDSQKAKELGFVIISGHSDDVMSFDGAIDNEGDCYDGGVVKFTKNTVICNEEECEEAIQLLEDNGYLIEDIKKSVNEIEALWCPDGINDNEGNHIDGISWAYKTKIPHETFFLKEDGEFYCRGIVFNKSDLK